MQSYDELSYKKVTPYLPYLEYCTHFDRPSLCNKRLLEFFNNDCNNCYFTTPSTTTCFLTGFDDEEYTPLLELIEELKDKNPEIFI